MNYPNRNGKRLYKPSYSIHSYLSDFLIINITLTSHHLYNCIFQNSASHRSNVISSGKLPCPDSLRCFFRRNFFCEIEAGDTAKIAANWALPNRRRMSRHRRSSCSVSWGQKASRRWMKSPQVLSHNCVSSCHSDSLNTRLLVRNSATSLWLSTT